MRLYYASDIHGSERLWRKFLNAPSFYDAEVLVMGGDMTGKVLVPLVERKPDVWHARVLGREQKAKGEEAATELERRIRLNGFYPLRVDELELTRLETDDAHRDRVFREAMSAELRRWLELAHDKLDGTGVRCYVMPGNDDEWDIDSVLDDAPSPVLNVAERVVRFDGVQMLSSAFANPTPWDSPREEPEVRLLERFEQLAAQLQSGVPAIFNLHCPPHDSGLDLAPELTSDLRIVTEGGQPKAIPVGSTAVRQIIESRRPLLGLHGHIHECRGVAQLGPTLCINPGSAYGEGVIDGAVVEIIDGEVVSHQLVSG
jgi:Icc-related predicted phosphoesterase